jgi:GNAT superfamily N-acetyltransferase
MTITLREITGDNRGAVLALRTTPAQEQFVSTVAYSLTEAEENPEGNPWLRAVYADEQPVGFVMLSWNVPPAPPEIIGPWFLWKIVIDRRHQGRGYGAATVRLVADLVRAEGATELVTSYVAEEGGPAGFYERLGFTPTGDLDDSGEVIVGLPLAPTG